MEYETTDRRTMAAAGRLTNGLRARIDAVRTCVCVGGGRTVVEDSTGIIREVRERRSEQLYRAASGGKRQRQ